MGTRPSTSRSNMWIWCANASLIPQPKWRRGAPVYVRVMDVKRRGEGIAGLGTCDGFGKWATEPPGLRCSQLMPVLPLPITDRLGTPAPAPPAPRVSVRTLGDAQCWERRQSVWACKTACSSRGHVPRTSNAAGTNNWAPVRHRPTSQPTWRWCVTGGCARWTWHAEMGRLEAGGRATGGGKRTRETALLS